MKFRYFGLSLLALALALLAPPPARAASFYGAIAAPAQGPDDWEMAPHEFREVQRKGFHDGIEAARDDFNHHRTPNVERHDNYRHPHLPYSDRDDFREGFRRGYDAGVAHLYGHDHDHTE